MKRNTLFVLGGLVLVLLAAVAALLLPRSAGSAPVARITLDGEVAAEWPLSPDMERKTLTVTGKSGLSNEIVAEKGQIWVEHADCPDQICVNQGRISDSTVPIVCLPNQLIIEIVGGGDGLDAANG